MPKMINDMRDLEKALDPLIKEASVRTRDEMFEIFYRKVLDYYEEPVFEHPPHDIPDYYERTGRLLESLTASHVTKTNNGYTFTIGWDDDYITFRYPIGFGKSKYNGITGAQVLQSFNSSTHGFTVDGEHNYFDEAMDEVNSRGGADGIFIKHLKKLGAPIM